MHLYLLALILSIPTSVLATLNGPCWVGDTPGVCIPTAKCKSKGGKPIPKYCKGDPTDVQCCTKTSCATGGKCRWDSQCIGRTSLSTFCPGPADFRCCVDQQPPNFSLYGINECGAEYGEWDIPGTVDTRYRFPAQESIQFFLNNGMNAFRIPFLAERMIQGGLTNIRQLAGPLDQNYLGGLKNTVKYITDRGAYAIVEPHNFGWYPNMKGFKQNSAHKPTIIDPDQFYVFWYNIAAQFKDNRKVIFDINNEYADMEKDALGWPGAYAKMTDNDVFYLNQVAIEGIRTAGATVQLVLVEGNHYTSALHWPAETSGNRLLGLNDIYNNLAYEMHVYLNKDENGESKDCIHTNPTTYLKAATDWCEKNGVRCFMGEFGANAADPTCATALVSLLNYLKQHKAWIGALWWYTAPWWGQNPKPGDPVSNTQYLCAEPAYGTGINKNACPNHAKIMNVLKQFKGMNVSTVEWDNEEQPLGTDSEQLEL